MQTQKNPEFRDEGRSGDLPTTPMSLEALSAMEKIHRAMEQFYYNRKQSNEKETETNPR